MCWPSANSVTIMLLINLIAIDGKRGFLYNRVVRRQKERMHRKEEYPDKKEEKR